MSLGRPLLEFQVYPPAQVFYACNNTPISLRHDLYDITMNYNYHISTTPVNNEKAVDVQYKEQTNKESVENPIYEGRGNFNKNYVVNLK